MEIKTMYTYFDSLIRLDSLNPQSYVMPGAVHYESHDYKGAIPYFKKAIKLVEMNDSKQQKLFDTPYDNDTTALLMTLGTCLSRAENTDEAIEVFKHLNTITGDRKFLIYEGRALIEGHRYKEAIVFFSPLISTMRNEERVWYCLGEAYLLNGSANVADSLADEILKIFPQSYGAYKIKGESAIKQKKLSDACTYFQMIIVSYKKEKTNNSPKVEYYHELVEDINTLIERNCKD